MVSLPLERGMERIAMWILHEMIGNLLIFAELIPEADASSVSEQC
jgi:hypothetical protein